MHQTLLAELGLPPFRPRAPWWGPDLQTLRDTLRGNGPNDPTRARPLKLPVGEGACLLALLDLPDHEPARGLVLLSHGLGGSSESEGTRRLSMALRQEGFAVLRLNLRGAGAGRSLAPGTYAADCNRDLLPVLRQARRLAAELGQPGRPLPLAGTGLSLGGTILLNAQAAAWRQGDAGLDALACISSPLDLQACTRRFEQTRNLLYQRWLVRRLRQQVLDDHLGLQEHERRAMLGGDRPRSIRAFDALITAPRWGHASVEAYYSAASPMRWLTSGLPLPPTLVLHATDDPWVPAGAAIALTQPLGRACPAEAPPALSAPEAAAAGTGLRPAGAPPESLEVVLTSGGGHNGFHAPGDSPTGSWSDRLTARWLRNRLSPGG